MENVKESLRGKEEVRRFNIFVMRVHIYRDDRMWKKLCSKRQLFRVAERHQSLDAVKAQ